VLNELDLSLRSIVDQFVATFLLLLICPLLAVIALAVRLDSPGPIFFVQTRLGLREKPFQLVKFRTMRLGTPETATHMISKNAVTRVGVFLRRTKLDELPQLINVLRGDMSFVGPRPCLPSQRDLIDERRKRGVFSVRPGVTGLAQVAGIDMSEPERLAKVDALYIGRQSLLHDIMIVMRTLIGRGQGDPTRHP